MVPPDEKRGICTEFTGLVVAVVGPIGPGTSEVWSVLSRKDYMAATVVSGAHFLDTHSVGFRVADTGVGLVATRKYKLVFVIHDKVARMVANSFYFEHWDGAVVDGSLWDLLFLIWVCGLGNMWCVVCYGDVSTRSSTSSLSDGH